MNKKSLSNSSNTTSSGHGFGLGLLVGGMAGIASYYLFGTKEGQRLRKKLVEEFEYAQVAIPKELAQIMEEHDAIGEGQVEQMLEQSRSGVRGFLSAIKKNTPTEPSSAQPKKEQQKPKREFFRKSGKKLT